MIEVIVLDIDGGSMLQDCIASIRAQTLQPSRILILDNGSRTPVMQRVAGVAVHRSETNLGFAAGVNAAYALTSAPFVAVINNDVVLEPEWLASVREAFDRDPQLAAVQTLILQPDGKIDGAGIEISDGTFRQIGHGSEVGAPLSVAWGVSATATLYRAQALGNRMFDERLFTYYEDVELCARLRKGGWRTAVLPLLQATHRGSASASVLGGAALRLRTRNRYLVARMHPGVGRLRSLLWEDLRLLARGRTSLRGIVEGLTRRLR